jgi:hypothetical protein
LTVRTFDLAALPVALAGGFAATLVFTLLSYYAAPVLTGFPLDVAAYFADKLGGNAMLGSMAHYVAGTIGFPLGYLAARPFLPESWPARGLLWGAMLWLGAMLVVFPLTGAGFFMSAMVGTSAVFASLIGHLVYGLVLAALFELSRPAPIPGRN